MLSAFIIKQILRRTCLLVFFLGTMPCVSVSSQYPYPYLLRHKHSLTIVSLHWEHVIAAVQEWTKKHRKEDNMPKKGTKSKKEVDNVPNQQENKLPDYLELQRTRVVCNADAPIHVHPFLCYSSFMSLHLLLMITCITSFAHVSWWNCLFDIFNDFRMNLVCW